MEIHIAAFHHIISTLFYLHLNIVKRTYGAFGAGDFYVGEINNSALRSGADLFKYIGGQEKAFYGYGGAAFGKGARHLRISRTRDDDPVEPSEDTVISGRYPISRFLYCYVNPSQDRGDIAAFLRWIRAVDGQRIVRDVGYYPLPPALRAD